MAEGLVLGAMRIVKLLLFAQSLSNSPPATTSPGQTEEVKAYLRKLLNYVSGLHAIVISDRDGVPMMKVADEHAPELALRPAYLSTFSHMTDQASKMGMGTNQSLIAFYDNMQVVQLNQHPLTVTFIAEADTITGEVLNLELDLKDILVDLRKVNEMQQ